MTRIRKEPNRYWSKENKLKMINEVLNGKSSNEIAKKYDISGGMLRTWVRKYREYGEGALINKKKPGNPMSKYFIKKHFESKEEELEYEIMKLRIENERLKKGYLVKGDGSIVVFKK
jgi:transposase-like protein